MDRGYNDVKVQITASKKDIYLILVYGITEHPMMPATNKEIKCTKNHILPLAFPQNRAIIILMEA